MLMKDSVEAVVTAYAETWRRNDMDAWGALFTEDCDFVGWGGQWWRSRAENVAGHKAVPASIADQRQSYALEITDIDFVAPDVALVHALWSWRDFIEEDGARPRDRAGILTMVMVRRERAFRIRASHNTRIV